MKVNQNISAVISNAHLHRTEDKLAASIQRLSSGYKINSAKDSPSGMAISNKMRAQIDALDQSTENASDGISVIQTADGALTETHAILQRMRELSVQAATDSMTPADKEACQAEISQLQKEIDRIAGDTEFNSKIILDGSQDTRVYPSIENRLVSSSIRNFQTSDEVSAANYSFKIIQAPEQASMTVKNLSGGQKVTLNGATIEIPKNATDDEIYAMVRDQAEMVGVTVERQGTDEMKLTSIGYGSDEKIDFSVVGTDGSSAIGTGGSSVTITIKGVVITSAADFIDKSPVGKDAVIELGREGSTLTPAGGTPVDITEGFSNTATYLSDGQKVTITDKNGFEMVFKIDPSQNEDLAKMNDALPKPEYIVDLEVTDLGDMTLQVGAHENQTIDVRIPAVNCETLYIDDINVIRTGGADKAMAALDLAIEQVSKVRSRLGAYQNRLEYAVSSLEGTTENMESAISRIMDTDMAEEMSEYSNMNVLDQAAISVLSQANDLPQQILQMLG